MCGHVGGVDVGGVLHVGCGDLHSKARFSDNSTFRAEPRISRMS